MTNELLRSLVNESSGLSVSRQCELLRLSRSTDITYVRLGRGHVYLSDVIDWFSRYVVSWRVHDTLEAEECVACMDAAVRRFGVPAIANSDQGSTFTSEAYVSYLASKGIAQSMDGKGRWADNVIV